MCVAAAPFRRDPLIENRDIHSSKFESRSVAVELTGALPTCF